MSQCHQHTRVLAQCRLDQHSVSTEVTEVAVAAGSLSAVGVELGYEVVTEVTVFMSRYEPVLGVLRGPGGPIIAAFCVLMEPQILT